MSHACEAGSPPGRRQGPTEAEGSHSRGHGVGVLSPGAKARQLNKGGGLASGNADHRKGACAAGDQGRRQRSQRHRLTHQLLRATPCALLACTKHSCNDHSHQTALERQLLHPLARPSLLASSSVSTAWAVLSRCAPCVQGAACLQGPRGPRITGLADMRDASGGEQGICCCRS